MTFELPDWVHRTTEWVAASRRVHLEGQVPFEDTDVPREPSAAERSAGMRPGLAPDDAPWRMRWARSDADDLAWVAFEIVDADLDSHGASARRWWDAWGDSLVQAGVT